MAIEIVINGQVIEFPNTSESPDWSPGIIQFAEAVEAALAIAVGTYDVSPQVFTIDAYNPGSDVPIPNLAFSTLKVRSATINYSVFRNTSSTTVVEEGEINVVYNPAGPVNNKWLIDQNRTGNASISFEITDGGQVTFTTVALAGTGHNGTLSFSAKSLQQSN